LRLLRFVPGDPRRCGGVDEAACGARKKSRRAEPAASGRKIAKRSRGDPSRARGPGILHSQPGARPLRPVPETLGDAGGSADWAGTLLNILLEIGMSPECPPWECPRGNCGERNGSERTQGRERS